MSDGPTKPRWHQFTLKRLMIATFWLSISLGMTVRLLVGARDRSLTREHGWLLLLCAVTSDCLAFGSLFQRTLVAVIIGASVVLVLWAVARDVFWAS
jgi:hypothetical protein